MYFATAEPHGVLRVELDRLGSAENTTVTDVMLDVADTSPDVVAFYQSLAKTAGGLNTAVDAMTGIQQGAHRFDKCAAASCTLVVDIKNTAKSAVRVHLRADWTGDGAKLGNCESNAGPVAPGARPARSAAGSPPRSGRPSTRRRTPCPARTRTARSGPRWCSPTRRTSPTSRPGPPRKPAVADDDKTDGSHAVYEIDSGGEVWKYGVVPNRYWHDHAADQLRECMGGSRSACSVALVTVADDPVSAHALAAQLVADYQAEHEACPGGQWVSCAR